MVILGEIFDLLAKSEVLNTKLSKAPDGTLAETEYVKVVGLINLALISLYKRFNLRQDFLRLHVTPEVSRYYLREDRIADAESMDEVTYIEETPECFDTMQIIKVVEVRDEQDKIIPLNDNQAELKIINISEDILRIDPILVPRILTVFYQAYTDKIEICEDFDPYEIELEIPAGIVEAILPYVASKILITYEGETGNGANKSVTYAQIYEMECQKIETFGLDTQVNDHNMRFEKDGWT